jgi:Putative zinc-binding metallo-peptidase
MTKNSKQKQTYFWTRWSDEKLLNLRFCDLKLRIQGSALEGKIRQVYRELEKRKLNFQPHFWLSNEWFCPDGVPGIAIPFYLAHPRLIKLERNQMLEVEGGTHEWCMKIFRHEVGHAIDNAFKLRLRKKRRKLFGKSSQAYPEFYSPKPYSKSFVLHLDSWYAQSHPDEDFAETFAVWLSQDPIWRYRYSEWPAFKKLEYMDELMSELIGQNPFVTKKKQIDPISDMKQTLGDHYKVKREKYGKQHPSFYDRDLRRLFSDAAQYKNNISAEDFIKKIRRQLRASLARWTGEYQYTIDQILSGIIQRCNALNLRLAVSEEVAMREFIMLVTVQTMNYLHSGKHRIAL